MSPDLSEPEPPFSHASRDVKVSQPSEKLWLGASMIKLYSRDPLRGRLERDYLYKLAVIGQIFLLCSLLEASWEISPFLSHTVIKKNFCDPTFGNLGNQSIHPVRYLVPCAGRWACSWPQSQCWLIWNKKSEESSINWYTVDSKYTLIS